MTTYSKLKDGSWGLRGKDLLPGMVVNVTMKDGQIRQETVDHVLWTGEDGITLATRVEDSKPIGVFHAAVTSAASKEKPEPVKTKAIKVKPGASAATKAAAVVAAIDQAITLLQAARENLIA